VTAVQLRTGHSSLESGLAALAPGAAARGGLIARRSEPPEGSRALPPNVPESDPRLNSPWAAPIGPGSASARLVVLAWEPGSFPAVRRAGGGPAQPHDRPLSTRARMARRIGGGSWCNRESPERQPPHHFTRSRRPASKA
jgi:hypothetical protein